MRKKTINLGVCMNCKRIIGIILIICGVGLYIAGSYVAGEVAQGRKKISSAQKSVNQLRGLTNLSPITKDAGDLATGSAQKKIDAGRYKANTYQVLAGWLHGVGIAIFVIGIIILVWSFFRKKN